MDTGQGRVRWQCACGAWLTSHADPARDGYWIQHGENPECRVFTLRIDMPDFVGAPLVRWLDSVHAYRRDIALGPAPWWFTVEEQA